MFPKLYTFSSSRSILLFVLSCCLFLVLTSFSSDELSKNDNAIHSDDDCNLTLIVENKGDCPLYLYEWLSTGDVFETIIQAGDSYSVETEEDAIWRVTNGDFNNLVYDENIIATFCPEETWVTYPVYCNPPMTSWDFDCDSGRKVEIIGEGIQNEIPHTLNFDNSSNIYKTIVEVVYKGGNPGPQIVVFDNEGNPFSAYREVVPGSSSNVWVYRATMPGTPSASIYNTNQQNRAQSMVAYLFRENVPSTEQSGVFTYLSGYNNLESLTFDIPTAAAPRDIILTVPISELTEDGRYLMLEAGAGGVSNQTFVYGPSNSLGCCLDLVEVVLNDVPGAATTVFLNIDTRHNQNGQNVNGQSYVLAGAVEVDASCGNPGEGDCDDILVTYSGDCDDPSDCLESTQTASFLTNVSGVCPTNGPSNASCSNNIICIASVYNDWDLTMVAQSAFEFSGIEADFWYPTDGSNAGGTGNSSSCPTSYNAIVKFYVDDVFQTQTEVNVTENEILTKLVSPSSMIYVPAGSELRILIDGQPTDTDCDLFELAGLRVLGCENIVDPNEGICKLNNHNGSQGRLIWFKIATLGNEIREYAVVNNSSQIETFTDGTALITGTVEQINNSANRWEYHVRLKNKRTWDEWSDLGRGYKSGVSGTDHTSWDYYEVDNTDSYFTGLGDHAGQSLNISHNPGNYEFGFQIGVGANVKNGSYGLSGWFSYTGAYTGNGDFNGNLDDCNNTPPQCAEFDAMESASNYGQNNGKIVVTSLDLAANYQLFLDGNLIAENQGSPFVITDLAPGTYTVLAKGFDSHMAQGCEKTFIITITEEGGNNDCEITPPLDLNLTCIDDLSPNFTGYPTITCDNGGSCARDEGYHELNYETFAGSTSEWSFDQGWQIGSGCTPSCGSAPNAYIDFSNFQYAYDRSLTSPVFDACCMDNVQIDYCVRSDLYTNDFNNAPIQYLDVQYKIGNGSWTTIQTYQSENGATNDYNENDLNIPGAAGEQLRIRFRARGSGGNFTLGGWGVDQLRVEGNSPGCAATLTPGDYDLTYSDEESGTCPKVIVRTWTATPTNSADNCTPETLVHYDMDGCTSFSSNGTNYDYSEFIPAYPNAANCVNISASNVYRNSGAHSCIAGQGGSSEAACFGVDGLTSFQDNSSKAIRFEVTIDPADAGRLTALKFYEMAPDYFSHISGNSGTNNYPQKYGIRVLKNGTEIFKQININTTQNWSLEHFDFSNNSDFEILSTTTFQFELLSYDAIGNGGQISAWDLDNIQIEGCCGSGIDSEVLTATQIITIDDQTAPDVSNIPADVTIECNETEPIVAPTFMDICDADLAIVYAENVLPGLCDDNYTIVRTWTATDDCGNARTATQLVTLIDTTDPVFSNTPFNMTAECDAIPAPATLTATDNCDDDVLVSFNENIINGSCEDNYQLERIWIATDNCGNTISHTQIITVTDMTPPVFAPLADVTLECSDDLTAPNPVANDNCDTDVMIILNDEYTTAGSCSENYTITRVWTATDNCGNQSTLTQVATVQDTQAPSVSAPADDTVLCDAVPAPGTPSIFDNCDNDVAVVYNEVRTDGNCPNNYTLTRTWTATDNCGNTSSDEQVLTVIDATGPEILDVPASVTVECDEFTAAPTLLIEDNCDANATIVLNEEMQLGVCDDNYTVIRTWTATDACGNTTTAIQVVTVTDTTDPVLAGIPADATVECDAIPAVANPTASDNCDTDVLIEFAEQTNPLSQNPCGENNYKIIRIWKATDNCGNVDIQQQEIIVEDTTDPVLGNLPADQTVECDDVPVPAQPTATDNCDGNVDITFSETSTKTNNGACTDDTYIITRIWVATDNCGNTDSYTQTINVEDTTDPILANIPADITINTLPAPAVATPTASDNCDGSVAIDFVEVSGEGCSYEIVRTWTATDNCGNQDVQTQTITVELDPQAGTLDIDDPLVCLAPAGNGNISATPNGDSNVPVGFDVIYILTKGNGLVIEQTNSTPNFTALTPGDYTIHTLIYVADPSEPNYLDLSTVVFGTTTGFDVNALLQQGGGLLCGSLDVAGAKVIVDLCDAKIGNMVFEDINANGIMDAGEPGIEGVIVNLEGTTADGEAVFASQMTDADGKYYFENLAPGSYKLTFIKPIGYEATYANEGGDNTLDSDADPISGMTVFENLESGEDNDTYDAGFFKTGKIGDMVFVDTNANGIMDLGEAGIENVEVILTGTTGNGTSVTLTTTTDVDGKYIFEGLTPGSYKLTFVTPTGFVTTYPNEGGDDALDSDVDPTTNMTDFEELESGETNLTYDAGYYELAKIGNFVFEDLNADGIQNAGEPGISGVEVLLTGTTGNGTTVSLTTTTDANGNYVFDNLVPGDYKLTFGQPQGFAPTYADEGGDDELDSDADPISGMTVFETLESGEDNDTYDAGFFKTGKIGDMVFVDKNGNGIMDMGEEGIEGVEVTLTGTTGNGTPITLTTTTDADGKYIFDDLAPGTYKLTFATPAGFVTTYPNEGGDDTQDSDVDPTTSMTDFVTIESGEENLTLDAGYYEYAKIGDMAFVDANANGIMDAGEVGIEFVNVVLEGFTGNGTPVTLTTQTDADGKYLFDNLVPGVYKLTFTADPVYQATNQDLGGDDALDSDIDPITGMTDLEVLESGETNLTYDAGYYLFGKIGDFVWLDCNKDGMQSPGEEGIEGVVVRLFGTDGFGAPVQATTTTDADGKYEFDGLIPGVYLLTIDLPTIPTGYAFTTANQGDDSFDSDFDGGATGDITITSGLIITDIDGGLIDDEAPVFAGVPADVTVECDAIPAPATPTATDNLDLDVTITFVETSTQSGNTADCQNNTFTITRTWTAEDNCGNISTATQVITVEDTTDPILMDVPADVTVECDAIPAIGTPSATDNCDVDAAITFNEVRIDGNCEDNYTLERTWTATDNCGNDISQTQTITVQDTTDPGLIGVPADVTVECDLVPAPATPEAIDNCDADVDISFNEVRTDGNCADNYTLTRTWIATDNCGNTDTKVQVITVQDTTDPNIFDIPANVTVECDAIPAPSTAPFANDNCDDDVAITFVEVRVDGNCEDNYTLERTWTATDNCGNDISQTQIITVQDTTDPILSGVPADATVECDAVPNPASPTATDNCDVDVDITYVEVRTDGNCADNYTLTRTWTATDNCGNEDIQVQVITVQDTTDPILSGVPADATVECDAVPNPATPTAADNCDVDVAIDYAEVRTDGNCDDNYTLTRTWTATDNCGNEDIQVQVITVQDTTDPILSGVPADVTVECDVVPSAATPTAADNCDADVEIVYAEVRTDGVCEDTYTLTRTWTATDNCGNTDVQVQVIQVQDTTDPNIYDIPANVTVECDAVPAPSTAPFADDNCDDDVEITFVEVRVDGNCEDNYTLERTWTATDNCGNTDSGTQIITVQDTTDPELIGVPANVTIECDLVPAPATPVAVDNCDADVVIDFVEVRTDGTCEDTYTLTRTWTATDNCGNTDVQVQVIQVQDTTDPNIYDIPANVTVECDAIPAPSTAPYANDNCDADVTITFAEVRVDGNCEDNYTLERTWTATDNCGNTDSGTQIITVQDTTDPILFGIPADTTVECDAVPNPASPTATDNCDVDVDITYVEVRTDGTCDDNYTLTRTWTATDNCGNEDIQVQVITVQDTTDPILSGVPADATVECDAVPAAATPTAADNCDADVTIDYVEVRTDGVCEDTYTLTRTWTATDNCGNTDVQVQEIQVQDTTDPTLYDVPANITVECDAVPAPSTAPFADDNCDADVTITFAEVRVDGNCEDNYTLERTWTATDNCGNDISQTQTITVQDTTDPELIGVPANVTIECDLVPAPATPVAIDNCDADVDIDFVEVRTDGNCVDNYILTRTWTATDNCGNQDVKVQIITVQDTSDPNIYDIPANVTVECDAIPAVSTAPFANDNCDDDVEITFAEVRVDGNCEDNYTLERTWTATDNCGNNVSGTQVITVQDTTDPILAGVPADATVECDAIPNPASPTATDNCDTDVTILLQEIITDGNCIDNYTITRTWTATDNCGNTDIAIQVITVQDTTDPILAGVPADATVECDAVPAPATPTATDNCDADVDIAFEVEIVPGTCPDSYTMIRKWTATDNCGNQDVQIQNITVQDTTDPTLIDVPANVTVECDAIPAIATPTAEDNCDPNPIVTFNEVKIDGNCEDNYTLERTWTATDACGNDYSETQIITVQDTTDPVMAGIPADVTVECDLVPAPAQPFVNDNCDNDVDLDYTEVRTDGNCEDNYTLTRTWIATDNCGNATTQVQVITVQDTTDPALYGVPNNVTVECDAIPLPASPTANDNCDTDVEISFLENITDGNCEDNYTITRTWIATDNCGNTTEGVQIITVQDTTDPVLAGIPANETVECDAIPAPVQPTATDNCDADVTITFAEVRTDGNCEDNYTLTRTWTATDNCGNTDVESQIITVQDTTDPIMVGVPADATVECDAVPAAAQPTATDNCDANVSIDYAEVRTDGNCLDTYTLTRTWTATDNCGNTDIQVQVIEVQDTTDPILSGVPADATIDCNNIPTPAQPTATDNCDIDVVILFDENIADGSCADNYTITRTWTATDNCGNSISQTQTLTVQDMIDPTITGVPADATVECDAVPAPAQPIATDNCDTDVDLDFTEVQTDGNCIDNYTLTRTWIATDNCGNTTTEIQVITVEDTRDPALLGVPANVTVECDAIPLSASPTANDNCDTDVEITFVEERIDGNCEDNYTLERTWTATDNCGNTDVEVQIITVQDTTNPTLSGVPGTVTVECDAVPAPLVIGVDITATDNCDADVSIVLHEEIFAGLCADNYTILRTYTATDNCGNEDVEIQIITVEDTTPPTISGVPADLIAECDEVPAAPAAGTIIVADNCDADVATTFSEIIYPGSCADSYVIKRIWTATDNCGNITTETQNITVSDVTPPTLDGVPADTQVDCNSVPAAPAPGAVTATDNCDVNVFIQFFEELIDGACDDSYVIKRTWTATDNCGNEIQETQIITVGDATGPVLTGVPADLEVECNNIPAPANPTATDDCDTDVDINFTETTTPGACENSYILTRTWIATDNCGNETVGIQNITVQDTQQPILAGIPTDTSADCNSIPAPPANVTATDNCDTDVTIDFSETSAPGACANSSIITRTWTATDNCGNSISASQTITVGDASAPTLANVPANVTVECNAIPQIATNITATDNCDTNPLVSFVETNTPGDCTDSYVLTRTWTATDACGNESSESQIIMVQDTQDPTIAGVPADVTIDCNNVPAPATPIANDNCDTDVNLDFAETSVADGCGFILTRTWTATDNCGNTVSASQTLTVTADDPVLSNLPADTTVECDNIPLPETVTATSDCLPSIPVDFVETIIDGACANEYTIERTWTTNAGCGTPVSHTQTITVQDTTDPTLIDVPANVTVECNAVPQIATNITATDNCDTNPLVSFGEILTPGACENSYTLTRTWTATDACGNEVSQSQTITVEDTQDPILAGIPADVTVDCNQVPAPASPVANDNCDTDVDIDFSETSVEDGCGFIITRTWTATDNCGNSTAVSQTITVAGDEPVFSSLPADLTVECNNIPAAATLTAQSNCAGTVQVDFVENIIPGACENSYTIERTWSIDANAACGTTISHTQTVTVEDTQQPILAGIPSDTSADCNSVPAPPANVTATDNCDTDVTIDFSETSVPGACANSSIITRTWTATDNCGNTVSASQTITVGDASAPTLENVPANVTVECNAIPQIATNITATDNCDTNPLVSFEETNTPGACENSFTLTRTWTATDACGNESSESQIITVQDTQDPTIAGVPADVTIDCNNVPAPATPIANDNCDTDVNLDFAETSVADGCGFIITRTWTATDNCGNTVSASQTLTVTADAPVLSNLPTDTTVECDNIPLPETVTATSDCLPNIPVDFVETIIDGACADSYTIERTWTTNAGCGTAVSHTQTITVQDTTDPILIDVPTNVTVECNAVPQIATNITATDNCDTNPLVSFSEILTPGACENSYTLTRTWTATDDCGNEVSQSQTITVEDTQDPILAGIPADVTVDCNQVPAPAAPVANDNCDTDVDIDFSEVSVVDGCGLIITRTWTATDNCGNSVAVSQTITVGGDEPVFSSLPADLTVECNNIPTAATLTAQSNCAGTVQVDFVENIIPGACENSYTIERTWSIDASAACGTTISHTQTVEVEDTQQPILAGVPADTNVGCGNVPTPANPIATDNCDTDVDIIFNEVETPLACGYELVRTWTATDNCGNSVSASQTITVEDTEDPILIGVPADETANCDNIPPVAANVTVTDNCSTNITIDFAETNTPLACGYILTRTWTATDDCGNTDSVSQNITVGDNTPPTLIDVPANITVECASIPGAPYVGASDNCDFDVEAILSEVETPLACGYLITRTWTAIDDCGNETTGTQEVTVTDTEVPSLWEIPADVTVECGNIPAIDQGVGVLDNCDPDATLDFTESYIAGDCADNFTIVRTWTATDNCGNTISDSQNITVEDTQSPILAGVPTDLTVDCNNVPTPANLVATDNCDTDVDVNFAEVSVADGCGFIITRTWTATDNCGNAMEVSQTITVNADAPILSSTPADITAECNNIPTAATVTAQSVCAGTVQVDFVENIIPGACENSYTIERTWSIDANAACGNAISHTQTVTVEDTQDPILAGVPADLNAACGNVPAPANPIATDNCDTDVEITFNEIENPLACGYELIRTWTATDNCGNSVSASQTITVEDTEDPILIGVPADETVSCGTVPTPATVTATDNCDNDVEVVFAETSVVDGCETIITRTWTATDDCGNEVSESQIITVNADPATLSAMPADITVECSNIPVAADLSAFDGCTGDPIQLDFVENIVPGICENSYTIERTWSVASGCGNGVSHTQSVTVEDTTDPTLIGVPADQEVECGMIPTAPIVTGTDNCDTDVTITFNEVETPAACGYILTRTWTATDNCGNTVSASQNITVGDDTPPVVAGVPANVTVECDNIPAIANNPITTDNCDADVEISFVETNTPGACADSYTLTRTWTATDDCGNATDAVQTIFVQDTTDPTLIGVPNNLTIDFSQGQTIPTPPTLIGTDNCDTDVAVTYEENQIGNGCSYTLERTWTATDNCGNTFSATQIIEVIGGLNLTETHVDASCGESNGSIDLTLSGGVAPITFAWSNGVGNIEDQTGLTPGIYEVTVTDGTGCTANLSIEIEGTGALQVDILANAVSCYEGNDGSISVTMTNGLAPFTYDWTGGIGNTPNPTNLTAGSYNVTITDAYGCTVSTGANVNQPQELIVTIDSDGGGCAGGSGTATANVDGGTMPYQYAWSNGETTSTISNLDIGTYTVIITDNNGCTIEDEVTISSSSNLIITIEKTDVSCYLDTDGTATATVIGGQPDYNYLWSNGETNATIVNLEAGTYTVTITDGAGCIGTQTITIISPPELQLTTISTEVTPVGNDGTATVNATGGTLPYQYIWSNGQTTQTAIGLSVGNYSVTVIDDNGCFAIDEVEVIPSTPTGDVNIGDYVWFDTNRDGIQDADEVGFNNVMVKLVTAGLDGIFGTSDDVVVATETTANNPSNTAAGYYLFENVAAGTYQIEFMLSSLPNDYMLTLANQGMDNNLDSDANPLTGRTSTFTVVAGQMDDLSFDAGVHPECNNVTTGGAILATQTICAGEVPDLLVNSIYPTGGGGDLEYIWLVNTTGSPFSSTDPAWTIIQGATDEFYQPGQIYTNTYFVRCVRRSGCTDYTGESNIVSILVTPLPSVEIEQAPSSLCLSESTSFQAAFAGATATYLWDFGAGASPQTSTQRNVYNLTYSSTGTKTVTLTVENMGCSISTTHEFEVTDCLNDFIFMNFVTTPEPNGTEVLIDWTTEYEVNESRFFLEHSKNGDDFQTFEVRNAQGSAQQINSYQAIHAEPYYGVNYYRIKYVDANGQITYSKIEVVVFDNGTRDIHVYPNPVVDFTYVEFLTELTEDATIEVVDIRGRVLSTQVVADGFRTYRVSLADYPAGTYLIWVRYNDYRKDVERVVKITE